MTSVMSARSPLSISKCRESVWPEAARRKGGLCQGMVKEKEARSGLNGSRVEIMGQGYRKLQIRT